MDKKDRIRERTTFVNGKCGKCGYEIIRKFRQNPNILFYRLNILRDKEKVWGMCPKCYAEFELPMKFFTVKYIIKKTIKADKNVDINQSV